MRRSLPVLLVTSLALLATACSPATTEPSAAAPVATDAPATSAAAEPSTATTAAGGGALSFAVEGDLQTLDPAICYDTNCGPVIHLLFDQLIEYDPNAATLRPGLAASMPEVSADGLTYTFTLRDNATFTKQDGSVLRPVTADDVVHSLNRVLDPSLTPTPSPVGGAFFAQIAGADKVLDGTSKEASGLKAVDPKTVAITINAPNRAFLNVLGMNFASIVPKELAGSDTTAFSASPIGTGPFYLASYTRGEKALLQRNTAYWREGYPRVDTVEYRLGVDANTQLQQVQAGQLDIMGNDIPAGSFTSITTDPALKDQVIREPLVATNFLVIDTSGPDKALADPRVRQAMAMALDKDNLLRVNNGRGTKAGCIYPPQMTSYDEACDPYPHDLTKAKALMADAGFASGFEHRCTPTRRTSPRRSPSPSPRTCPRSGSRWRSSSRTSTSSSGRSPRRTPPRSCTSAGSRTSRTRPTSTTRSSPARRTSPVVRATAGTARRTRTRSRRLRAPTRTRRPVTASTRTSRTWSWPTCRPCRCSSRTRSARVAAGRRQPVPSRLLRRPLGDRRHRLTPDAGSSRRHGTHGRPVPSPGPAGRPA